MLHLSVFPQVYLIVGLHRGANKLRGQMEMIVTNATRFILAQKNIEKPVGDAHELDIFTDMAEAQANTVISE